MSPGKPLNIAVLGTGFMGRTHLDCYLELKHSGAHDIRIHTICSKDPENELKNAGAWGNIDTQGSDKPTLNLDEINLVNDWQQVINNDEIDAIDICLPTPVHAEIAIAALAKGKHVLCEKPLALTTDEALKVTQAASASKGIFMPAMVMRFWPEWMWLISTIKSGMLGPVKRAHFVRNSSTPPGWYRDVKNSGGSLIDLHIHDIDFVYHAFGMPDSVTALHREGEIDQWIARYDYNNTDADTNGPVSVTAEGGWLGEDYPFAMQYQVDFAQGDASFNINREQTLLLTKDGKTEAIAADALSELSGYTGEIVYFLDCIRTNQAPSTVTAQDAFIGLTIAEAEQTSAKTNAPVILGSEALARLKAIQPLAKTASN